MQQQHTHVFDARHESFAGGQQYRCLECQELVVVRQRFSQGNEAEAIEAAHHAVADIAEKLGVSICRVCWVYFSTSQKKRDHICRPEAVDAKAN
jgi:hypothetical protein